MTLLVCCVYDTSRLQGPLTWAPFDRFTGFSSKRRMEITEEEIRALFLVQLMDGCKLMTAEFIAYGEWTLWRSTRNEHKGPEDFKL